LKFQDLISHISIFDSTFSDLLAILAEYPYGTFPDILSDGIAL
jgi:hypothetical protein